MFFKALHEVARHTALSMIITPQGARLRVIIMPKPGKDAKEASALSKPIEATGTPEELDAELPKALAAYAEKVNDLRVTIKVPTEALDAAKAKAGKTKTATPKKAAKKPKAPAKPRSAKPAKAAKPKAPAAPKAAAPRKTSGDKTATPRASLPGKEQCLADLRAYIATGKDLNRAAFIAWARKNGNKTGRRFEKLWSGWHEFHEHAVGKSTVSGASRSDAPPSSNRAKAPPASASTATAPEPSGKASKTALNADLKWPFPDRPMPGSHAPTGTRVRKIHTVHTDTGTLLGNCSADLTLGDKYTHPEFGDFRVVKVEDEKYTVQRFPDEPDDAAPPAAKTGADLFKEESKQP